MAVPKLCNGDSFRVTIREIYLASCLGLAKVAIPRVVVAKLVLALALADLGRVMVKSDEASVVGN